MLPIVKMPNIPKKPTCGQLNDGTMTVLSEDQRPDDWVLHVGHWRNSVSSKKGQGELMGSIRCMQIPFILVVTSQSYHSPLSPLYSADPLVDPKTYISTSTIELFFVMILMTPYAYESMFYV